MVPLSESELRATVGRFGDLNWDFTDQRSESDFSDLHWHPCRFPSQIPSIAIGRLSSVGGHVLDPFCGSGTTLVEAQRLGRRSTGIDINPVAGLAARAKLLPVSAEVITEAWRTEKSKIELEWPSITVSRMPPLVQADKWYLPSTISALRKLWAYVQNYEGTLSDILTASFSAILLNVCREDRHWGYVCDNSAPKPLYEKEKDVLSLFIRKVDSYCQAYASRDSFCAADGRITLPEPAIVYTADAKEALQSIPSQSVDLVVTSPPYFGVADYVKAQRLTFEWLGYEIEPLRLNEIGARSKRRRLMARSEYLNELTTVFGQVRRVLKPSSWCVIIFGESTTRSSVEGDFLTMLESIGLSVHFNKDRSISNGRRQKPSVLSEKVVIAYRTD